MNYRIFLILTALVLNTSSAYPKTYTWVDDHGITHYSSVPSAKYNSKLIVDNLQTEKQKQTDSTLPEQNNKSQKTDSPAKKPAALAMQKKQCKQARKNLKVLEKPASFIRKKVKGKLVGLSEQDKSLLIRQQKEKIKLYCGKI